MVETNDLDWYNVHVIRRIVDMPARVDKELCIVCGACVGVCPVESITMQDDGKAFVDEATCIDCGACVATCPVGAISQ